MSSRASGAWWLALAVLAALLMWAPCSVAAVRRFALVVGNNQGDAGEIALRYAESDAQRVYDVLKDLGSFEPGDMVLLRGEAGPRMQSTLIALNDRIRATVAQGVEVILFVYYSGHAGTDALHMSGTHLDLATLEQLVRGSSATFRILLLDACRSGALTRVKGGRAAPPFDIRIDEHLSEQGLALLTSSAANEDSQESEELKGSFFSHHFVSALLGAGDADGDGHVTLEEAYRYASSATLRSSSGTWAGLQHPTYRYELQGVGRLALTELPLPVQSRTTLVFPPGRTYLVMDRSERGAVVAEVADMASARRLNLRAGRYFVRGRASDALLEGELDGPGGTVVDVSDDRLHRIAYARLVRKGAGATKAAHGPEAGYFFHTPFKSSEGLCQGPFAGYAVHFERLSVAGRLSGCRAGFANDTLRATTDEFGAELRAVHTWDLPIVGVDLGLAVGGWLLHQSFATSGIAPARSSPSGSLALTFGPHVDVAAGFSIFAESALAAFVYAQEEEDGTKSLGPFFAFRQAIGLVKVW